MTPARKALLLVDHGSRLDAANRVLEEIADALRLEGRFDFVATAHMDLAPPTVAVGLRRCVESDQASVAEIDLHEQMPEFIQVIARAAVSKARAYGGNRHTYEILIPDAALEAATASLDAEIRSD